MSLGFSESGIRANVSEESFNRGQYYFDNGLVSSVVKRGNEIVASVEGSEYTPYRVSITVGGAGGAFATCSCPYDWGGWCKHIVATMLACIDDPDLNEEPTLESRLVRLDKEQLIALVLRMVNRHDDLEIYIDAATASVEATIDDERIRAQVQRIFSHAGHDWRASSQVAMALEEIIEIGDTYCEQKSWNLAVTQYSVVLGGILENYESIYDNESEVGWVADTCTQKLGVCLEELDDFTEREHIFRSLIDTYLWDVNMGGYGISDSVPAIVLDEASEDERSMIAQWLREELPSEDSHSENNHSTWKLQAIGKFLLDLEENQLDDESYLQRCRETARWSELITRLFELGRIDEAVEVTRQVQGYQFRNLLDIFEKNKLSEHISDEVHERSRKENNWQLIEWLKKHAESKGNDEEALHFSEQLFWMHTGIDRYKEIKRLALKCGLWEKRRPGIEERLVKENGYNILTEIHLLEDELDEALECLDRVNQPAQQWRGWHRSPDERLTLRVAEAVKPSRPDETVRLYLHVVEQLIDCRGRDNYKAAARHLVAVRDLYQNLERKADWQQLIEQVRENHRNLPALKDELVKAGL